MDKQPKPISYRSHNLPLGSPLFAMQEWEFTPDTCNDDSLHFHNYLEIGYCYYGHGSMTLGSEVIPHSSNVFTVIPQNIPHMTEIGDKLGCSWEYLMINISEFLSIMYKDTPLLADQIIRNINCRAHLVKAEDHKETAALIRTVNGVLREQKALYLEEAKGLILSLLIRLSRWNQTIAEDEYPHHTNKITVISPALDYISRETAHPFKIEELARMCHISETHFRRVFEEYMGMAPVKYINQIRIRRACYELNHTNDSINAIAARSGFATLSTFNRNFKQITGLSPQQLRRHPELYDSN